MAARELKALESQLKAQQKLKHPDERVVKPLRHELKQRYCRLVLSDPALSSYAESHLWKLCFYPKITEFRQVQARASEQLADPAKKAAAEHVLAAAADAFGKFLDKGSALYLALVQKAALACGLELCGYGRSPAAAWPTGLQLDLHSASLSAAHRDALLGTCYRCLICLGDLERYRGTCLHDLTTFDWSTAEQHYRTAVLLRPHAGNPHNQCGVISNYQSDDLSGFYHYSRSILCAEPYVPQGRANLEMILRKNCDTVLEDVAPQDSQQRKRLLQDATLRTRLFGRWFVRPLALLNLLSSLNQAALAEQGALSRLPAVLDADPDSSDLCLRMVCACIFTVSDLERQMTEASHRKDGGDENQNGNKPAEAAIMRDTYQQALDFTLRTALVIIRSAKSAPHHLQAVCVVCTWLLQHPHLLSPQKNVSSVCYDSERLRRAQESLAEGLVDLMNLLMSSQLRITMLHCSAPADVPRRKALPEERLLVGWTPLKGALDGLVQDDRAQGLLVGVAALESADELLAARLERIITLVKLLAQQPGALVSVDSRTGEISVEGAAEKQLRSRDTPLKTAGGVSSLPLQPRRAQNPPMGAMCGECRALGRPGRVDDFDGLFYCDMCWSNLEAADSASHADGNTYLEDTAAGSSAPWAYKHLVSDEQLGKGAPNRNEDQIEWDRDNETFGAGCIATDSKDGVDTSLGDLARQTAHFTAAFPHLAAVSGAQGSSRDNADGASESMEYLEYSTLERMVERTVADTMDAADCGDDEEYIVFQPPLQPAQDQQRITPGNGTSFSPTQQSLWGGFGTGTCGFGPSGVALVDSSHSDTSSRTRPPQDNWSHGAAWSLGGFQAEETAASRFATRNPFAA